MSTDSELIASLRHVHIPVPRDQEPPVRQLEEECDDNCGLYGIILALALAILLCLLCRRVTKRQTRNQKSVPKTANAEIENAAIENAAIENHEIETPEHQKKVEVAKIDRCYDTADDSDASVEGGDEVDLEVARTDTKVDNITTINVHHCSSGACTCCRKSMNPQFLPVPKDSKIEISHLPDRWWDREDDELQEFEQAAAKITATKDDHRDVRREARTGFHVASNEGYIDSV